MAEGVRTTGAAIELARRYGAKTPLAEAVPGVLEEKIAPGEAADRAMRRQLRPENK